MSQNKVEFLIEGDGKIFRRDIVSREIRITNEITKQVFPLTLNLDDPRFRAGLERMRRISLAIEAIKMRGGVLGPLKRLALGLAAGVTFARLFWLPATPNALPRDMRVAPAW